MNKKVDTSVMTYTLSQKENHFCDPNIIRNEEVLDFLSTIKKINKHFITQIKHLMSQMDNQKILIEELQSQLQIKQEIIESKEMIIQECELQLESCRNSYEEKINNIEINYKMGEMLQQIELTQLKNEIQELRIKTQHNYSTTAGSFLQSSKNQESFYQDQQTLESLYEGSLSKNTKMLKNIINDPIKKQKEIIKREINQWQDEFFKKEGRPPTITDKQIISTKFYQYTILKKQIQEREKKNSSTQCNLLGEHIDQIHKQLASKVIECRRLSYIVEDLKGKVKVFCRVKPCIEQIIMDDTHIQMKQKIFQFDACFGPNSTQQDIYNEIQSTMQAIYHGYNLCIFTYGQTGSGKTFTMIGTKQQPGIIPRLADDLFKKGECNIIIQIYEIYRDNIIDLLTDQQQQLEIKDDGTQIYIPNLTNIKINNQQELLGIIEFATQRRKQSQTEMNDVSSRSHMCTQLIVETFNKISGQKFLSRINLIDLAGSEKLTKSSQIEDTKFINKSLSALNDVILAMSQKQSFIPYRNSKLTYLMRDSLSTQSKTIMIINVTNNNSDETINSLQYAQRVKAIRN